MTTKVFVGSLPSGSKPEELRRLFEEFGVVTECDVMNRCAFVHMETQEMAAKAIKALDGIEFKGEKINVEPGRVRERNQNQSGGGKGAGGVRQRGMGRNNMLRMRDFEAAGMNLDGIDEKTTKDALQLCSAVFEEMNKLLNPEQPGPRRGYPPNFIEDEMDMVMRRPMDRGPRNNRNGPSAGFGPMHGPINHESTGRNQGNRGPNEEYNQRGRGGPNQGNLSRMGGNQGFSNRNQGNIGRNPKPGNAGPIRNEQIPRQQRAAPYNNRMGGGGPIAPIDDEINFADDAPLQNSRGFSNNQMTGSQIDKWSTTNDGGNFGRVGNHPMNRNFNEDVPMNNFTSDSPTPIIINLVTKPSAPAAVPQRSGNQQSLANHGNFGHNFEGGNDQFQNKNDRFQSENNRFQSGNDRFQGGNNRFGGNSNAGGAGNFGNQDRRGFALPEKQNFNNGQKFGNPDLGISGGGNSQFGSGIGNMGNANRNSGFGSNNFNNNTGRQQNPLDNRNFGGNAGNLGGGASAGNAMFQRRNNAPDNLNGNNNMGNNRIRNDMPDANRVGSFGGNNNNNNNRGMAGLGNMNNANNAGFNRNNNMVGSSGNNNPIRGKDRNFGGGNLTGGFGNNNNRNVGGNFGNNNNRNMNENLSNASNMNRNNMGGGGGNQLNFQKDFPALPVSQNMNNRTSKAGDWKLWK